MRRRGNLESCRFAVFSLEKQTYTLRLLRPRGHNIEGLVFICLSAEQQSQTFWLYRSFGRTASFRPEIATSLRSSQ